MRRIITGHDAGGRSTILVDQDLPATAFAWETSPAEPLGYEPIRRSHDLDLPAGHKSFRYFEVPPEAVMAEVLKRGIPGLDSRGFHRTATIDFVVVLDGQLTLELDVARTEVRAGDVVVQRATNHAWRNRRETPARCLAVMARLPD